MADQDDLPYIVIERRSGGVGAFLLGAIVGAGAALLFAPRSGEETRDELRTGVQRLRDRAEQTARDLRSTVTETLDGVKSEVTGRVDAARDAFEAGRQAARDTRTDLDRRVNETRSRVRAGVDAARRGPPADEGGEPLSPAMRPNPPASASETDLGV